MGHPAAVPAPRRKPPHAGSAAPPCRCGEPAAFRVALTHNLNRVRAFYSCPNWKLGRGCDFLQWADARQDLSGFATPMAKVDALIWDLEDGGFGVLKRYDRGHLRLMKSHGGRWDAGSRMWCFPNNRRPEVEELLGDLELSFDDVDYSQLAQHEALQEEKDRELRQQRSKAKQDIAALLGGLQGLTVN